MNNYIRAFSAHPLDVRTKRLPQLGTESDLLVGFPENNSALAEERRRIDEDLEALRESEENLRAYEAHLRAQQEEWETNRASGSHPPQSGDASSFAPFSRDELTLQSAWEKVIRARELLEAEQMHLRDDRLQMRDEFAALKRREATLKAREDKVAARELALNASRLPEPSAPATTAFSSMTRFTLAPFNLARAVLRGSK
jgi:chromosome segregation ATPase